LISKSKLYGWLPLWTDFLSLEKEPHTKMASFKANFQILNFFQNFEKFLKWIFLQRTMATQLVTHERIRTTLHKALALRRISEKLITYSKKANYKENVGQQIFWKRRIQGILTTEETRTKILKQLGPRFK